MVQELRHFHGVLRLSMAYPGVPEEGREFHPCGSGPGQGTQTAKGASINRQRGFDVPADHWIMVNNG